MNINDICVLDNSLINKIAAGEVIERPSSVVKEIVENSIDANATSITIEIKDGGINQIRISDNGIGIPKNQIKTAFMRHATNKINNFEDLSNILTLGFRGEALSSIASVAQVEMITKTRNEETGTRIEIHGGNLISEQDVGSVEGTTFIMRNLFYNTPVRRKFLKKTATESGYISDIINKMALGHPEISFKYINNNSVILNTSGNKDLKATVFYVYGKDIAKNMMDFEYSNNGFELKGLLGKAEINRANRSYENFFINGRFVKSSIVQSAVEEAYKEKLMVGKFPVFIINMNVPSDTVDVNVHPTKLEVRFSDEDLIFDVIYNSVLNTLNSEILIPNINLNVSKVKPKKNSDYQYKQYIQEKEQKNIQELVLDKTYKEDLKKDNSNISHDNSKYENVIIINEDYSDEDEKEIINRNKISKLLRESNIDSKIIINNNNEPVQEVIKKKFFNDYKIIGQIFNTYWIIEQENSLYLIDQHAAHERILYENLLKKVKAKDIVSQQLLQPITINFSPIEKQTIIENIDIIKTFGFEIEEFGVNSYALRSVPFIFNGPVNSEFFIDIVNKLQNKEINDLFDAKTEAIAMISCKAAVKGNNKMSFQEAESLIKQIVEIENPFTCPHGRPTIIEITKYELEKKFKRIQN